MRFCNNLRYPIFIINSTIVGSSILSHIRLNKIQQLEGLSHSPLVDWPYTAIPKKQLSSFTTAMITFCRQHGFSFDINHNIDNLILGGKNTIRKALSESTYAQARNQLNNH